MVNSPHPASRPGVNRRRPRAERRGQRTQVAGISGQDVVAKSHRTDDKMCVDDIGRPGVRQQCAHRTTVVHGMHIDCYQEGGQASLTRSVSPDLGDDRLSGVQIGLRSQCGRDERMGAPLPSIDCDQKASIKDHKP